MAETKSSNPSPPVELQETGGQSVDSEAKIIEYEVVIDGRAVGEVILGARREDREVSIDWLSINSDERGKGYSKLALANAMAHILKTYRWANTITSSTDSVAAMRATIATPVPEGWRRTFSLHARKEDLSHDDEIFVPFGQTDDPDEALSCVEMGGSVTTSIEKDI